MNVRITPGTQKSQSEMSLLKARMVRPFFFAFVGFSFISLLSSLLKVSCFPWLEHPLSWTFWTFCFRIILACCFFFVQLPQSNLLFKIYPTLFWWIYFTFCFLICQLIFEHKYYFVTFTQFKPILFKHFSHKFSCFSLCFSFHGIGAYDPFIFLSIFCKQKEGSYVSLFCNIVSFFVHFYYIFMFYTVSHTVHV